MYSFMLTEESMLPDTSVTSTYRAPFKTRTTLNFGCKFEMGAGKLLFPAKSTCRVITDQTLCVSQTALCLFGASRLCLWRLFSSSSQKCIAYDNDELVTFENYSVINQIM